MVTRRPRSAMRSMGFLLAFFLSTFDHSQYYPVPLIPAQAGIQKVLDLGPRLCGDERIMIDHRPVQLCHMPSSKTARSAARSNPLAVSITSVAEIECFGTGVNCSPASVRAL